MHSAAVDVDTAGFAVDGYAVARKLFSADEVAAIRDTFMAQIANGPVEGLCDVPKALDASDPLVRYPRMLHPHHHADKTWLGEK